MQVKAEISLIVTGKGNRFLIATNNPFLDSIITQKMMN